MLSYRIIAASCEGVAAQDALCRMRAPFEYTKRADCVIGVNRAGRTVLARAMRKKSLEQSVVRGQGLLVEADDEEQGALHAMRVFLNKLIVNVRSSPNSSSSSGFLVMRMPSKPGATFGRMSLRIISRSLRLSLLRATAFLETLSEVMMPKRETLRLFFAKRMPRFPTKKDLPRLCTASMSDRL